MIWWEGSGVEVTVFIAGNNGAGDGTTGEGSIHDGDCCGGIDAGADVINNKVGEGAGIDCDDGSDDGSGADTDCKGKVDAATGSGASEEVELGADSGVRLATDCTVCFGAAFVGLAVGDIVKC